MKKNRLFAILIAFFTFSCFAQNWKADHVFLIGLDGWGAYSVEKAEMPNVKTLMDAGCYTLKKRSGPPHGGVCRSAPGCRRSRRP